MIIFISALSTLYENVAWTRTVMNVLCPFNDGRVYYLWSFARPVLITQCTRTESLCTCTDYEYRWSKYEYMCTK